MWHFFRLLSIDLSQVGCAGLQTLIRIHWNCQKISLLFNWHVDKVVSGGIFSRLKMFDKKNLCSDFLNSFLALEGEVANALSISTIQYGQYTQSN